MTTVLFHPELAPMTGGNPLFGVAIVPFWSPSPSFDVISINDQNSVNADQKQHDVNCYDSRVGALRDYRLNATESSFVLDAEELQELQNTHTEPKDSERDPGNVIPIIPSPLPLPNLDPVSEKQAMPTTADASTQAEHTTVLPAKRSKSSVRRAASQTGSQTKSQTKSRTKSQPQFRRSKFTPKTPEAIADAAVFPFKNCTKTFSTEALRLQHNSRHTWSRQFACTRTDCPFTFAQKQSIARHIKGCHDMIRDLLCPWPNCDRGFSQRSHLDSHYTIHLTDANAKSPIIQPKPRIIKPLKVPNTTKQDKKQHLQAQSQPQNEKEDNDDDNDFGWGVGRAQPLTPTKNGQPKRYRRSTWRPKAANQRLRRSPSNVKPRRTPDELQADAQVRIQHATSIKVQVDDKVAQLPTNRTQTNKRKRQSVKEITVAVSSNVVLLSNSKARDETTPPNDNTAATSAAHTAANSAAHTAATAASAHASAYKQMRTL